jgi:hypothetical protein
MVAGRYRNFMQSQSNPCEQLLQKMADPDGHRISRIATRQEHLMSLTSTTHSGWHKAACNIFNKKMKSNAVTTVRMP